MNRFLPDSHLETSLLIDSKTGANWPEVLASSAFVIAFGFTAGPIGVFIGFLTIGTWYVLGTPYAFAVGHIGIVVTFSDGIDPVTLTILEVPFVALLVAPLLRHHYRMRATGVAVAIALSGAGLLWFISSQFSLSVAAVVVLGFLGTVSYGIHRLELVRLGLVTDDREQSAHEEEKKSQ